MKLKAIKFSWLFLLGLITACDNGGEVVNFDRQAMLINYAENIIVPGYQAYRQEVNELNTAVNSFTANPSEATLSAVQNAFKEAYLSWQNISFYEFGPAMDQLLRTSSNTYPTDFIAIENNIASGNYNLDALSSSDAKGFPAIDYLLYGLAETDAGILDEYANSANTRQYLQDVTADLKQKIDAVVEAWTSGGYNQTFIERDGTDAGSSLSMMVNTYNLHLERFTRDAKIGIPLGIRSAGIAIPNNVEALYSGISNQLAVANLSAIRNMYHGESSLVSFDDPGINDYLEELNAQYEGGSLADEISQRYTTAINLINEIPDPLQTAVIDHEAEVSAAYQAVQVVVVLNKVDASSAMGITITYADNDGD